MSKGRRCQRAVGQDGSEKGKEGRAEGIRGPFRTDTKSQSSILSAWCSHFRMWTEGKDHMQLAEANAEVQGSGDPYLGPQSTEQPS